MKKFKVMTAILYWVTSIAAWIVVILQCSGSITPELAKIIALSLIALWLFAKYFILTAKLRWRNKHLESYNQTPNGE